MIGPTVTVIVDSPLGSYHPKHRDIYYPVNYGYIEGTLAADGEEEDAYILGVDKPLSSFTGHVIAIIKREDDVEHKWVVVPDGVSLSVHQIKEMTYFQEKYFKSTITML